jgi:hypothetical protein
MELEKKGKYWIFLILTLKKYFCGYTRSRQFEGFSTPVIFVLEIKHKIYGKEPFLEKLTFSALAGH